jgi:alpha-amylase
MLVAAVLGAGSSARAFDVSAPVTLQWFESSWNTIANRTPDFFMAGYGTTWTPPPGRADSGNFSVGYDPYNRFDLGSPGNPTLYGTQTGLQHMIAQLHTAGKAALLDLVWNHNGFRNSGTSDFAAQGGYPGFVLSWPGTTDGDFHSAFASGDEDGRIAGLIDIDQSSNIQLVRNPVPGNPNDIPAGTIANIPSTSNYQYYPDQSLGGATVTNPQLGNQQFTLYNFNNANPMNGAPVSENALGYLMRNARWLIQTIGADGFRLDATKNYPTFVLNYFDTAVFGAIQKPLLDGSKQQVYAFGEDFDTNMANLQSHVLKNINPATPNVVGGNRDTLDFPLYFAMQNNLTNNGIQNNWNNVVNSSFDVNDDGLANNGSQGVAFVQSADSGAPYLSNVAYAYTLMRPGNAIVYFNAHEFGDASQRSFPADGRGDALGGVYGNTITTLVDIRNRYGRGDYHQRSIDQNVLVYERNDSMIVALSNRLDGGFDQRTVATGFAPGSWLVELTGNADDATVDPFNDIPDVVQVQSDGTVTIRVPRNTSASGTEHDKGYVIYGPASPKGTLSLTNVAKQIHGQTPTTANNGTAVQTNVDVITSNSFEVNLQTSPVILSNAIHDTNADGDNALIKLDGGLDINGNGHVDNVTPNTIQYGFEKFLTKSSPLVGGGDGQFLQSIDATQLSEGYHYIDIIAYRHRNAGEPEIYSEFKDVIYVDRLKPISAVDSFVPIQPGINQNLRITIRSVDQTANNVHVLWDVGANISDSAIRNMISGSTQSTNIDTDLWTKDLTGATDGNHVATVVTFEPDGNFNVQRFPGLFTSTIFGAGLGDLNFDGTFNSSDVSAFQILWNSNNTSFNPAADFNGDGIISEADVFAFGQKLLSSGASPATLADFNSFAASVTVVPEPTAGTIVTLCAAICLLPRRRARAA